MAKRGYPGGRGGAGGANMQNLLKQAQQMQKQMEQTQEQLATMEFEAAVSGGGMVSAKVNGSKELLSIKIAPEAVDPDDVEMLEDMIVAAVREAIGKADKENQQKMGKFTSGMPGMF